MGFMVGASTQVGFAGVRRHTSHQTNTRCDVFLLHGSERVGDMRSKTGGLAGSPAFRHLGGERTAPVDLLGAAQPTHCMGTPLTGAPPWQSYEQM
jgi:hypothetical protein